MSDRVLDQLDPKRVIFVGTGATNVCYYRCVLPAMAMGADWIGVTGEPPHLRLDTGLVKGGTVKPTLLDGDYDVIVLQEVFGEGWRDLIYNAREKGIRVVYEINDYVHGIGHLEDHDYARFFTPERIKGVEECMEAADAVTVTTKWLKKKYTKFAKRIYVVPNGIDLARYELAPPPKTDDDGVTIGWAGATGHLEALIPWLQQVVWVMDLKENINFASIGQPVTKIEFTDPTGQGWSLEDKFAQRALSIPFCQIEQYPAAMTLFDIAIAPAGNTRFHRGKSDLRWVEASALGIPLVGSSLLYPEIVHGETGFVVTDPDRVLEYLMVLAESPKTRRDVGEAARTHVREHRTIDAILPKWQRALIGE